MIHNPKLYDNTEWSRPADWLPIDHLVTNGEQKIVGLYAIFPSTETYYHNMVAFTNSGSSIVDWGDGNIENIADNVKAEHIYDYDSIPDSTLCSRGYKQVIITITSLNVLNTVTLCGLHSTSTNSYVNSSNWLDLKMSFTGLLNFKISTAVGGKMSYATLLEKIVMYQSTNKLTNLNTSFTNCTNLAYCDLNGLNTENVTTLNSAFMNCTSLKTLLISNWNTGNVTDMSNMFYNVVIEDLDLSNFSTNVDVLITGISNMFMFSNVNKITLGALRIRGTAQQMFYGCTVKEIDISRVVSFQPGTFQNIFDGVGSNTGTFLSRLKTFDFSKIDVTRVSAITGFLNNTRLLEECVFTNGYFTNCTAATTIASASMIRKLRLPQLGVTVIVSSPYINGTNMNLLFGDLANLNGAINTATNVSFGTGYTVGDIVTVSGGNNDATLIILNVGTGGVPNDVVWYSSRGTGYSLANNVALTGGSGSGYIINITALKTTQTITITGTLAATDPLTDRTIATAKNWTVVG